MLVTLQEGKEILAKIQQTEDFEDRSEHAKQCCTVLKLSLPTVVDRDDNKVNKAYAGWPDRLVIVAGDGTIAYKGGPGPQGFKVGEVEKWLRENTGPD